MELLACTQQQSGSSLLSPCAPAWLSFVLRPAARGYGQNTFKGGCNDIDRQKEVVEVTYWGNLRVLMAARPLLPTSGECSVAACACGCVKRGAVALCTAGLFWAFNRESSAGGVACACTTQGMQLSQTPAGCKERPSLHLQPPRPAQLHSPCPHRSLTRSLLLRANRTVHRLRPCDHHFICCQLCQHPGRSALRSWQGAARCPVCVASSGSIFCLYDAFNMPQAPVSSQSVAGTQAVFAAGTCTVYQQVRVLPKLLVLQDGSVCAACCVALCRTVLCMQSAVSRIDEEWLYEYYGGQSNVKITTVFPGSMYTNFARNTIPGAAAASPRISVYIKAQFGKAQFAAVMVLLMLLLLMLLL